MTTDDNRLTMPGADARELAGRSAGDVPYEGYWVVQNELIDTNRWETIHNLVILTKDSTDYWMTTYSRGATEYQDTPPFEGEDQVTFARAVPKTVTVTTYERVTD